MLTVLKVPFLSAAIGHQKLLREEPHPRLSPPYPGAAVGSEP